MDRLVHPRFFVGLVLIALLLPTAAAQTANVRARIVPQYEEVALSPGERGAVDLDVTLQVTASCASGTRFGITVLMVDSFPKWAGASPEPANLQFGETGGSKASKLAMFPSEDAPPGQSVTYRLRPEVHLPPATNCTGDLRVESPDTSVTLTIVGPGGTSPTADGGDSPGFGVAPLGLALAGLAFVRRRR